MVKSFRALGACALVLGACAANAAAILGPNTALMPGQSLTSGNGQYMLIMQGDGNLVFYRTSDWKARWNSRTQGLGGSAWMQGDGNFVVYATQGRAVWDARTSGHPGAYVAVQDDGNLVIYGSSAGPLWWQTGVDTVPGDPESPGDVVGRESNDPILQGVGNIGMFDGGYIVGVTNTRGNAIEYETLASFKSRTPFWGTASPNNPNHLLYKCYKTTCNGTADFEHTYARLALVRRAFQAYVIGADYTYGSHYNSARPVISGVPAERGLYRSDTFIINVYEKTARDEGNTSIYPVPQIWLERNDDLKSGVMLPSVVFNKMKTWQ